MPRTAGVFQSSGGNHHPFLAQCLHHYLFARAAPPPSPCRRHSGRCAVVRARCHHVVHRTSALAALRRCAVDRCWLGHDQQRRHQCYGRTLVRSRPTKALLALNGASVGGVSFPPIWIGLIAYVGFAASGMLVAAAIVAIIWPLASRYLRPSLPTIP